MMRSRLFTLAFAGSLAMIVGCSKGSTEGAKTISVEPVKHSSHTVSGKVTYNGEPVRFGYVLMYSMGEVNAQTGKPVPPKSARIDESGKYTITSPVIGPCVMCLATDPDLDPMSLMRGSPELSDPGSRPGAGGPPSPGNAAPQGPGPRPPMGGPPGPGGMMGRPTPISPVAAKLTEDQKAILKEIHSKFNDRRASPCLFVVAGDADQTYDLQLKSNPDSAHTPSNPDPKSPK